MTRYQFAAGLNAALERVNELIATGLAERVSRDDLATLTASGRVCGRASKFFAEPSRQFRSPLRRARSQSVLPVPSLQVKCLCREWGWLR